MTRKVSPTYVIASERSEQSNLHKTLNTKGKDAEKIS